MLNRVILIGRLVADPELRFTTGGIPVSSFRIAVDRDFRNQQGETETDFINIVCWRKTAEVISKNLRKGRLIGVEGRLQIRQYQTQDGQNRSVADVVADRVHFLDRPRERAEAGAPEEAPPPTHAPVPEEPGEQHDDLPF